MSAHDETYRNINHWVVEAGQDVEIGWDEETRTLVRVFGVDEVIWQSPEDMKSLDQALEQLEDYLGNVLDPNPDEYGYAPKGWD